jgi:putative SOS response-associated peptidase YedK
MCGRFTVATDPKLLAERFAAAMPEGWTERYNVAPSQRVAAVRERGDEREIALLRWGLVPHWAKDPKIAYKMINARSETVMEKSAYKPLLTKGRCLLVADGFYEWRTDPDGTRRPVRFTLADGEPFAFAGLWTIWRDPESGEPLETCTILTTTANDLVQPVHDRMPVILPRSAEATWLDLSRPVDEALALLVPYDPAQMAAAEASLLVNSPRNDVPECFDPLA